MSITETLNEREKAYGGFGDLATAIQAFKSVLRNSPAFVKMTATQREAMECIMLKQCRVLYGDPMHFDSWRDIAGYAALAVEEFHPREDGAQMKPAENPRTALELLNAVAAG